jgi:SAM-dependent methyltransferase
MLLYSIVLALVLIFVALVLSYDHYERLVGVPTFPTMPTIGRKMIELLRADSAAKSAQNYTIVDLGSGSGQLTRRVALAMPEAQVIGIELSYIPWLRSVARQKLFGPKNLTYQRIDFWPYDCAGIDAVLTYLPGKVMERLGQKLRAELKPGALIIANTFALGGNWTPYETLSLRAPFKTPMYLYRQEPLPPPPNP